MKLSLQLKLSQQLKMTPQLQQAIRLLQMPVLELNSQLQQALAENVMLESEDPNDVEPDPNEVDQTPDVVSVIAGDADETGSWNDLLTRGNRNDVWSEDSRRPELPDRSDETLREHLLWQLEMEHFSPREVVIGHSIVEYINDDGYLTESLENIHQTLITEANFSQQEIEDTLIRLQGLDPTGVGARNLSECIRLQIQQFDEAVSGRNLALQIADDFLDLVAEQQFQMLRRRLGVSEEDLDTALVLVRSCHPRPGSAIQPSNA